MTRLQSIVLVVVVCVGGIAWSVRITRQTYDFDEVQRAHSIWMTSQGLRPYEDFFECHPPYFALLAPLADGQSDPGRFLRTLRWVSAMGQLLFLAGLVAVTVASASTDRTTAMLGVALVAFHPDVVAFLSEFRIDGWGYALALWTIAWFLRSRGRWRHLGLGVGTGIATLLLCPKLALLPPMLVVLEQVEARRSMAKALAAAATYAAGVCIAGGMYWVWLTANGITMESAIAYLVTYHASSNFHAAFGYGLLGEIVARPALSAPIAVAILLWLGGELRERLRPRALPAALALWLVAQAGLVSYPWKQYYAPWFLFGSVFFPWLQAAARHVTRHAAIALGVSLGAASIAASVMTGYGYVGSRDARNLERFLRILNAVSGPEDRVVATPPFHPIFRRDTFYVWFNTLDPSGYETEPIMDRIPLVSGRVSERTYRQELASHPPAIVVLSATTYPRRQEAVIREFIRERGYVEGTIGNVAVAVSRDHLQQFLENRARP